MLYKLLLDIDIAANEHLFYAIVIPVKLPATAKSKTIFRHVAGRSAMNTEKNHIQLLTN